MQGKGVYYNFNRFKERYCMNTLVSQLTLEKRLWLQGLAIYVYIHISIQYQSSMIHPIFCLLTIFALASQGSSCPSGYMYDFKSSQCLECQFPCSACQYYYNQTSSNGYYYRCTGYQKGYTSEGQGLCRSGLSSKVRYYNTKQGRCQNRCSMGCTTCSQGDYTYCFSCEDGFIRHGNSCLNTGDLLIVCMSFLIGIFLLLFFLLIAVCRKTKKNSKVDTKVGTLIEQD